MSLTRLYTIDGDGGGEEHPEWSHDPGDHIPPPRRPISLSPPRPATHVPLDLQSPAPLPKSPLHGVTILVVDDAASIRKVMIRTLQSVGALCDSASDGQAAINKVRERLESNGTPPYGLILMDSIMAPVDGMEATRQIRALGYPGLVFGATGNVMPDDIQAFLLAGVQEVLAKPLSLSDLEDCFQKHQKRSPNPSSRTIIGLDPS
jgi:CheY-like chemotaxis protein